MMSKKKNKKNIKSILFALIFLLVCFALGYGSAALMDEMDIGGIDLIFLAILVYLLFYLVIIIHEGGHLIFGLLTGYGFSSFRIGSLMWIKQDGKIRLRRFSIAGTGGQCLMTPPEIKDGRIPVILYNLGGVILNLLAGAAFILLAFAFIGNAVVYLSLLIAGVISIFMALTNGVPLNIGGMANDGMNAVSLSKDRNVTIVFLNQLRMNEAQSRGMLTCDMPDEWFQIPDGADKHNVHIASSAVFAAGRALDRLDVVSAEADIDALLNSEYNIIGLHKNLLTCDLITCRLLNHDSTDVSELLTSELRKFMQSMKTYPSVIATEYIVALLGEENLDLANKKLLEFERAAKKHPYPQNVKVSRALMDRALEKSKNK